MPGLLLFVLPDGHTVEVADPPARLICDRLWDQGIVAGAATAATRISEALQTHQAFRPDVNFKPREVQPLIEAAQVDPPTWTLLLQEADFATLPEPQRKRLLEVCDELIETLDADHDQTKVRALLAELELLRNNLRAAFRLPTSRPRRQERPARLRGNGTLAQSSDLLLTTQVSSGWNPRERGQIPLSTAGLDSGTLAQARGSPVKGLRGGPRTREGLPRPRGRNLFGHGKFLSR